MSDSKKPNSSTLQDILEQLRDAFKDFGPDIAHERSDYDWTLDPDDEDDRKQHYHFGCIGADPKNSVHRDLILDWLMAGLPFPGHPGTPDIQKVRVLEAVDSVRRELEGKGLPATVKAICDVIARRYRKAPATRSDPLGGMPAKTVARRYYHAKLEIRRRIDTERFGRNYSPVQLARLRCIVKAKR
jgi:hypothetical protein